MTNFKYNISGMFQDTNNPIWAIFLVANDASNYLLAYGILFIIFVVSGFVYLRKTSDIPKSLVSATFATSLSSLLLFYAGKVGGHTVLPEILVLFMFVALSLSIGGLYYFRREQ